MSATFMEATPLAWAYICHRLAARQAGDRYQRQWAADLRDRAANSFRAAIRAGGAEAAATRSARLLMDERLDVTDPGLLVILLTVPA
ncbi:hypothetical protein ACQW02_25340 [Humitalea sp. 24SJ18S-53]|uniref:hypothetical protein n=1 Tax=Humitalea sp. 24SJ18S-53 TaxID=3422307 RepID=UPI003D66EA52